MRSSAFVYNSALIWRWLAFAVTAIVLFIGALTFLWWSLFSGSRYDNIALALLIGSLCFCLQHLLLLLPRGEAGLRGSRSVLCVQRQCLG